MRRFAPALFVPLLLGAFPAHADERSYMLTSFDRIRVDGPYDVRVSTGAPAAGHAEGDKAALDRLVLRVDGGTLVVSTGADGWASWRGTTEAPPVITVTVPALDAALVNGGGRLSIDRMAGQRIDLGVNGGGSLSVGAAQADQLSATLTGTGSLTVAGQALRATFGAYGAGSIDASALIVSDLTVRSSSSGNGSYAARYTATVSALGLGSVTVAGSPKCRASGPGPVFCGDNVERR